MRKKFFTVLILIMVALCPSPTRAQQNNSKPQAKDEAQAALRNKAYDLLESLAGQLGTMQSPENRARIGSNIAWSLWTHNETKAREVLASVQQDINAGLQASEGEDPEDVHTLLVFMRLRTDTVERIAQRDPELAYEFFKATALGPNVKLNGEARTGEAEIEAYLARQVAANNPDIALQIAKKRLALGFSEDLITLIRKLNRKHKEQAMDLYKAVVEKLSEADLAKDWNARSVALTLANSFAPPAVKESDFNDLVNLFVKAAVENGCMKKLSEEDPRVEGCRVLSSATELISRINPTRARQLDRWREEGAYYYSQQPAYFELEETAQEGTVDDVLALIPKNPEMADEIRWRAFRKAQYEEDYERLRKIANEAPQNSDTQRQMLYEVKRINGLVAINEEMMADLTNTLNTLKDTGQRIMYLAVVANRLGEKDRKLALKLVNQADQMTDTMKPGLEQTAARIWLAMIYCQHKSDRGFAIMESLLPKLNEVVEASAKLDGFGTRYLRDGEWNMTGEGLVGELLTELAKNAGYFAYCDFDRAVTLAAQFDRAEIRIMAQLKLAQGVLGGPLKPLPISFMRQEVIID